MFSGIVQEVGTIVSSSLSQAKSRDLGSVTLTIRSQKISRRLKLGSSIAVNGVCTTVEEITPSMSSRAKSRDLAFTVRLMPITLKLTTLGALRKGDRVNIEPSLRVGDELGGHFVMGHVDGIAKISRITDYGLRITVPRSLIRFITPRGSIAVDGVSLTVAACHGNVFTISLVDYTLKHTTLGNKKIGDRVNIEIDPLARYALA